MGASFARPHPTPPPPEPCALPRPLARFAPSPHADVKPANVLLRSNPRDARGFTCKLGDFGYVGGGRMCAGDCGRVALRAYKDVALVVVAAHVRVCVLWCVLKGVGGGPARVSE